MIDEFFERWVDRACIAVPRYLRPRLIRMADSALGWRICLYCKCGFGAVKRVLYHIKDEEQAESFAKETLAKGSDQISEFKLFMGKLEAVLRRYDAASRGALFGGLLFLWALAVLGVLATGGALLAGLAAGLLLFWLAEGLREGYAPVAGRIRQRYLGAMLLDAGGHLALTFGFFRLYASGGLPTNIVLQSAMIVMLLMHAVLFLAFAAFEKRQQPLLRLLTGLLGVLPALMGAASLAAAASLIGASAAGVLLGIALAMGALLIFMKEMTRMIAQVGLVPLPFGGLIICIQTIAGHALLLAGAWALALL